MSDKHYDWLMDGIDHGWAMPAAHWAKRLPLVRHIRAMRAIYLVDAHDRLWRYAGFFPTGYDQWVIYGMWHGLERPHP